MTGCVSGIIVVKGAHRALFHSGAHEIPFTFPLRGTKVRPAHGSPVPGRGRPGKAPGRPAVCRSSPLQGRQNRQNTWFWAARLAACYNGGSAIQRLHRHERHTTAPQGHRHRRRTPGHAPFCARRRRLQRARRRAQADPDPHRRVAGQAQFAGQADRHAEGQGRRCVGTDG